MNTSKPDIVLVTPVWNDSARLGVFGPHLARALSGADFSVRWIIADDGSRPEEKEKLEVLIAQFLEVYPRVEMISSGQRSRKGGAIYCAWDACAGADLLAFVDADGAIDARSTVQLLRIAVERGGGAAVVGMREPGSDAPVRRTFLRALSFCAFGWIVRWLVGIQRKDTQCGAKVVPGAAYRAVSGQLKEKGFVFDVELLIALEESGCRIEELRIPWREVPGGKVYPMRDAWGMIAGLLRVRRRLKAGGYSIL